MKRLEGARELLDGPLDDRDALRGNLRDLRRVNQLTGGMALSERAIDALTAGAGALSVIDVGTGAVDIPLVLLADARRHGRRLHVTAVDSRAEVLQAARAERPALDRVTGLSLEVADGRRLPYAERSFDVAHASLVLHHLEPPDAVDFLLELARVASRGIVVNDLARGYLAFAGAWLWSHLFTRNRYTRHDASLSVRRAYTMDEARLLMADAGLRPTFEAVGLAGHRWAMAAVTG